MFLHFSAVAAACLSLLFGNHQAPLITPLQTKPHIIHTLALHLKHIPGLTIQEPTSDVLAAAITPTDTPSPTPTATPTDTPTPMPTATPTAIPTPTPTVSIPTPVDLDTLFSRYADQYHADKNLMEKIAKCESSFNNNASYMDYLGMFQFGPSSWSTTRTAMGADPNPDLRTNPEEAIKTAAYVIGNGGSSAWPSCTK